MRLCVPAEELTHEWSSCVLLPGLSRFRSAHGNNLNLCKWSDKAIFNRMGFYLKRNLMRDPDHLKKKQANHLENKWHILFGLADYSFLLVDG